MSKFSITNITLSGITLPPPYGSILPPGKGIIVEDTEENILAQLGGPESILGVLRLQLVSEGNLLSTLPSVSPVGAVVYRPGATGEDAPGGNVYTDWALLIASVDAIKHLGQRVIEIDDRFVAPLEAEIPDGTWNITNVKFIHVAVRDVVSVHVLDGARFVIDPPVGGGSPNAVQFDGYGFLWRYDGIGDVVPFDSVPVLISGNAVRFYNTNPLAKPMFKAGPGDALLLFSGDNQLSGLGELFAVASAAPVYDVAGSFLFVAGGGGVLDNNVFTDSVGGGFILIGLWSYNFVGNQFLEFDNPALIAGGGFLEAAIFQIPQTRYIGYSVVDATPYAAAYNEYVKVSTGAAAIQVDMPRAATAGLHETVVVKDFDGNAAVNNITITPTGGDTVDSGLISTNGGCKIWVSDGVSRWMLTSSI